jgi:uncharacterized DUF497 family protein
MSIKFEWDSRKARDNVRKHGIDFNEASTVFADTLSITILDPVHSEDEERWITMGLSNRQRLVVVVHTEEEETIRLISARAADRFERRKYEEGES